MATVTKYENHTEQVLSAYYCAASDFAAALKDIAAASKEHNAKKEGEAITRALDSLRRSPLLHNVLRALV